MDTEHWGLIEFRQAWDKQRALAKRVEEGAPDTLVTCEHPSVITLGRTTKQGSVLAPLIELQGKGIPVVEIDRGGEATVHNPGQLVAYPIFDLQRSKPDLHWFLRSIEEAVIATLGELGISASRVAGRTGVWIDGDRKICAIGIHCRRWITTHGLALNVDNDLGLFQTIVPCGITDKAVTSIQRELGQAPHIGWVREVLVKNFRLIFLSEQAKIPA